jgi:hypothetical protein
LAGRSDCDRKITLAATLPQFQTFPLFNLRDALHIEIESAFAARKRNWIEWAKWTLVFLANGKKISSARALWTSPIASLSY